MSERGNEVAGGADAGRDGGERDALLPRDTRRSLPIALLRARESVMAHFRPMLARHDVTEQQWRVIRVLAEAGELDASQLAARALILAPSLTRMIRLLERRRLIATRKDTEDGRRTLIRIEPPGLALINEIAPESRRIYAGLEARYGKDQIDRLLEMLDALTRSSGPPDPDSGEA
ncbi:homoprotocatechuate degradation operon regulator HpaR [Polymorphum gilvum]|uniref:Putative homoprotocatechuate degradative operon repressor, transcriptional regulatory protein MarR family, HpcR-like protein n=1 Tax=Polymorphum gilvum (strain LMG 25793 / CGMCC 1.9160 / SL003B-26A1) TaxID=991905 RepID=F2IX89_POLGS|nr:homoprotocatechuate degradation operon regulator HpaR [Polymorphum gilvum]ADZ70407.1 Putative homoprotocatechuate degradative operon repressor, transcriptional regulatory protein MarR family, HpcR-like protein [Polymorphum gilvum SL003B-26A1]